MSWGKHETIGLQSEIPCLQEKNSKKLYHRVDTSGRGQDLHLYQDHVRAEQALRLEQVYRGGTQRSYPGGRV